MNGLRGLFIYGVGIFVLKGLGVGYIKLLIRPVAFRPDKHLV